MGSFLLFCTLWPTQHRMMAPLGDCGAQTRVHTTLGFIPPVQLPVIRSSKKWLNRCSENTSQLILNSVHATFFFELNYILLIFQEILSDFSIFSDFCQNGILLYFLLSHNPLPQIPNIPTSKHHRR